MGSGGTGRSPNTVGQSTYSKASRHHACKEIFSVCISMHLFTVSGCILVPVHPFYYVLSYIVLRFSFSTILSAMV